MAHALTTNARQSNLDTTLFTNDTAVLEALVFSAQTLVVLDRAEDLGTEKTVTLRLEGTVVMVSGFFTSPKDQERIMSGDARPMRMASNSLL
jgi:hypothetical protein